MALKRFITGRCLPGRFKEIFNETKRSIPRASRVYRVIQEYRTIRMCEICRTNLFLVYLDFRVKIEDSVRSSTNYFKTDVQSGSGKITSGSR